MSDEQKSPMEQLQTAHNELYKKLYEHYMALKRLMEHAIISIDTSCQILLDAAQANQDGIKTELAESDKQDEASREHE
jgi:hypothetical protein